MYETHQAYCPVGPKRRRHRDPNVNSCAYSKGCESGAFLNNHPQQLADGNTLSPLTYPTAQVRHT